MNKQELRAKARKNAQRKKRVEGYFEQIYSALYAGLMEAGYASMKVMGEQPLVYTLGLSQYGHPNVCSVGGDGNTMANRLMEICEQVKAGKVFKVGDEFSFGGCDNGITYIGKFVEIDAKFFIDKVSNLGNKLEEYLNYPPVQYIQLVWPDIDNNPITDEHYITTQQLPLIGD